MKFQDLIKEQNVTISVTGEQLAEFANNLLSGARAIYEKAEEPEQYLTTKKVCELLQITHSTAWRWNKENYLNVVRIGGKVRYKLSDVERILGKEIAR